jgi:hypothetical protein
MVSIPDTCVFANHGALADRDLQHRNQVNSGRDYDVVADLDASIHLRFEIEVRIEENIFPKPDAAWTDHMGVSQNDHRFMQRGLQPRREPCVSEESPPHVWLAVPRRKTATAQLRFFLTLRTGGNELKSRSRALFTMVAPEKVCRPWFRAMPAP